MPQEDVAVEIVLADLVKRGLTSLKMEILQEHIDKLVQYIGLLMKWNKVYNLTAIREPERMVSHHIMDSASVLPYLPSKDVLDVGTGPGLPGIPLAILRPTSRVTLLDVIQKKAAFLRQAAGELDLRNVDVVCERVESWNTDRRFPVITSRAFSELADFVGSAEHLLEEGGRFAAMKGVFPKDEIDRLPSGFHVESVIELRVPGIDAQRHLVMIGRS